MLDQMLDQKKASLSVKEAYKVPKEGVKTTNPLISKIPYSIE